MAVLKKQLCLVKEFPTVYMVGENRRLEDDGGQGFGDGTCRCCGETVTAELGEE